MNHEQHPEQEERRRRGRLILALGGTLGAVLLVGFGGLAAWTVTTQNNGSTFSTGTVHHSNTATVSGGSAVSCTDLTSPGACGAIFTLSAAKPGSSTSGTVVITNTGSLTSTFALGLVSANNSVTVPPNTICSDLDLTVVDNEGTPASVYSGKLGAFTSAGITAANGDSNWLHLDTGTYTFTVSLPGGASSNDMGATCTAAFNWSQTNT